MNVYELELEGCPRVKIDVDKLSDDGVHYEEEGPMCIKKDEVYYLNPDYNWTSAFDYVIMQVEATLEKMGIQVDRTNNNMDLYCNGEKVDWEDLNEK